MSKNVQRKIGKCKVFHRSLRVARLDIGSGQHIKTQRHYFADKGPYSQSYGLSGSHVQTDVRAGQ